MRGAVPKLEGSFPLAPPHLSSEHITAAAGSLWEGANKRCTVAAEGTGSRSPCVQQQQQGGLFLLPLPGGSWVHTQHCQQHA